MSNILFAQLTHIALLLAPLLAVVAFVIFIVYWSHRSYTLVYRRTNPPSTYEERKEYRLYFRIALLGGLFLISAVMYWWMQANKPHKYVFQGVIVGLEKTQTLLPKEEGFYLRSIYRETAKDRQVVDYAFAIVRDTPFVTGQLFEIGLFPEAGSLSKVKPEPVNLTFTYSGMTLLQLTLQREDGNYRLTPVTGAMP